MANYVFLDTEVFIKNNFSIGNQYFSALIKHIKNDEVYFATSDIIINEIRKKIEEKIAPAIKSIDKFHILKNIDTLNIKSTDLKNQFSETIFQNIDTNFLQYADRISIEHSSVKDVFDDYFNGQSPFQSGKLEFPDAFVANSLLNWATANSHKISIVSGNTKDWGKICERENYAPYFTYYKDLASFLSTLVKIIDSTKSQMIEQVKQQLQEVFRNEFANMDIEIDSNLSLLDYDSYPELNIDSVNIEYKDEDINFISYNSAENFAEIEIQGYVNFSSYVDFPNPSSGCYDSEMKEVMFYSEKYKGTVKATRDFSCIVNIIKENNHYKIEQCEIIEPRHIELIWESYDYDYCETDIFTPTHLVDYDFDD